MATIRTAGKNAIARLSQGEKLYVPARNSGLRLSRRFSSAGISGSPEDAIGGAGSGVTAVAATTRSGGNVTITSVPMRSLDLRVNVPPWRSTRLLAMGRPSPAPCSADLIEFE